jgi:8-oxo-dGTP diphosphatase
MNNNEIKKVGAGFGVLVIRDDKVLLGKRHDDPEKASSEMSGEGTWTMPGGKLEFGESFEDGAIRELKEETNIDARRVKVMCIENSIGPKAHFVTIGLFAEEFEGEAMVMEPDEITQWEWFGLDSLPEKIFPPSRYVLERYLDSSFYKKSEQ